MKGNKNTVPFIVHFVIFSPIPGFARTSSARQIFVQLSAFRRITPNDPNHWECWLDRRHGTNPAGLSRCVTDHTTQ